MPDPWAELVIMISLFFRNRLIARKHFLCIVKSRESIVLSQYNVQGRWVGPLKQCVVQQNWHCDVKAVPTMIQIRRRFLLCTNTWVATQNWDHATARNFQCQISYNLRFRTCLVVSLRALPKRSRLSETSSRSFFLLDFDSALSSSNARYLQNLILSKNVRNSRADRQCDW